MAWPTKLDNISFFYIQKNQLLTPELELIKNKIIYNNEVESYHPARKEEFILGRLCAYMAILNLTGHEYLKIDKAEDRSPIWPNDIIGSISHSEKWICCAVALKDNYQGLGIDLETINKTKISLTKYIKHKDDLLTHQNLSNEELLSIIFSTKEALYKCLFPQVKKYFGFLDASLSFLDLENHKFQINLVTELDQNFGPGSENKFDGKIFLNEDTCLNLIALKKKI